jgi:hypothetical protein
VVSSAFLRLSLGALFLTVSLLGQVLASSSPEAANVSQTTVVEDVQLCRRFVDQKLALWRQRLKLEDWQISVVMVQRGALKPRTLGGIRWDKRKRSAVISVLDPSEYRLPFGEMLTDLEFTLVHELVHLELASLPRSEASRRIEEHAVNRIAAALL